MNNLLIEHELVEVGDIKYKMLFTVESVYYIEQCTNEPLFDVLKRMKLNEKDIVKNIALIMQSMVKKKERNSLLKELTENTKAEDYIKNYIVITQIIMKCIIPDRSEEDNIADYIEEEVKEHGEYDFPERMFTIGHMLGYKDKEIWSMVPRKIIALSGDYNKYMSGDRPKKQAADFI